MPRKWKFFAVLAVMFGLSAGMLRRLRPRCSTNELAAQSRPRIIIHPRQIRPGPNAKRYCRAWLAKEYRVSGPVIVPQQQLLVAIAGAQGTSQTDTFLSLGALEVIHVETRESFCNRGPDCRRVRHDARSRRGSASWRPWRRPLPWRRRPLGWWRWPWGGGGWGPAVGFRLCRCPAWGWGGILMDITTTITPPRVAAGRPCAAGTIITGSCAAPGVAGEHR